MAVAVAAALLTMPDPTAVQVTVTGLTAGQAILVTGSAGGWSWPVPGGDVTVSGTSVVLVDNRAALNAAITYAAVVAGATYTSTPVTVPHTGYRTVLQTLDGEVAVAVAVAVADARDLTGRAAVFTVAGRRNPPTRYDTLATETGTLTVTADAATTAALKTLLASGAPLVRRSVPGFLGAPPVELIQPTGKVHHGQYSPYDAQREWSFEFVAIDEPEPSVTAVAFDWDDFDTIYATSTWTAFDAAWAASTWDQFDRFDWGQLLP